MVQTCDSGGQVSRCSCLAVSSELPHLHKAVSALCSHEFSAESVEA